MAMTLPRHLIADMLDTIAEAPDTRLAVRAAGSAHGLSDREVLDVVTKHGYPRPESMRTAARILRGDDARSARAHVSAAGPAGEPRTVPTLTQPDELRVLINTAKAHPSKRIQNAATRLLDQAEALRELIADDQRKHAAKREADAQKAAARREVQRLQEQLRKAKAKLRGDPSPASTTTPVAPSAVVRAWAAQNGIACPARGVVPKAVADAYAAQHASSPGGQNTP